MKQRLLAILLTIALICSFGSLPVWAGPTEDGAITLNLGNGIITIYPDGYTQGNGEHWKDEDMIDIMLDVARTSLRMLSKDLFGQLTE